MAIEFRFDPRGFGVVRYTDPFTFEEFAAVLESAIADPAYRPGMPVLSDRRQASPPPSMFVRQLVRLFERHHEVARGTRLAVVVASTSTAAYGMARMQEVLAESANIIVHIFTDYDEAVRWLLGSANG